MLPQRVATAVVGVPAILGLIWLGGVGYAIALAAVLALAALEFFATVAPRSSTNSVRAAGGTAQRGVETAAQEPKMAARFRGVLERLLDQRSLGLLGVACVVLIVAAADNGPDWWVGSIALLVAVAFLWVIWQGDVQDALHNWLVIVGGAVYIGFLGSHLILLRDLENGRDWVILAVFATFIADTAAYFVGRAVGRIKLAPHISPGKTVEGTVAGLLVGALGVVFLNWVLGIRIDVLELAPLAVLLPVAAIIGDLAESVVKRSVGVKDAGGLLPGHGGFLDRIDAVLFTNVLVYYYVIWIVLP